MTEHDVYAWRVLEEMEEHIRHADFVADWWANQATENLEYADHWEQMALRLDRNQWISIALSAILTALIVWSLKP